MSETKTYLERWENLKGQLTDFVIESLWNSGNDNLIDTIKEGDFDAFSSEEEKAKFRWLSVEDRIAQYEEKAEQAKKRKIVRRWARRIEVNIPTRYEREQRELGLIVTDFVIDNLGLVVCKKALELAEKDGNGAIDERFFFLVVFEAFQYERLYVSDETYMILKDIFNHKYA